MTNRMCYHADESFQDPKDRLFNLIRVVENEPGYYVVHGFASLVDAKAYAKSLNDKLGVSVDDVFDIRASSMTAAS